MPKIHPKIANSADIGLFRRPVLEQVSDRSSAPLRSTDATGKGGDPMRSIFDRGSGRWEGGDRTEETEAARSRKPDSLMPRPLETFETRKIKDEEKEGRKKK